MGKKLPQWQNFRSFYRMTSGTKPLISHVGGENCPLKPSTPFPGRKFWKSQYFRTQILVYSHCDHIQSNEKRSSSILGLYGWITENCRIYVLGESWAGYLRLLITEIYQCSPTYDEKLDQRPAYFFNLNNKMPFTPKLLKGRFVFSHVWEKCSWRN